MFLSSISGNLEITVDYLVEIDKLVQLIESPIFACKFRSAFITSMFELGFSSSSLNADSEDPRC